MVETERWQKRREIAREGEESKAFRGRDRLVGWKEDSILCEVMRATMGAKRK